jgi:hypothetical protein
MPFCSAGGRLDPQHGDLALVEELQQVAVVGGDLHDVTVSAQRQSFDHLLGVAAAVLDPAGGVRGEVCVVGEDPLRCLELLELHQKALSAHERAQRVKGLHRVDCLWRQVGVGERRGTQVREHGLDGAAAQST